MRNIQCVLLATASLFLAAYVSAAPVVDANQDSDIQAPLVQSTVAAAPASVVDTSHMSMDERISRLEQLVAAQGQMQLSAQLQQLQQQVSTLQGQNDILRHELDQLQTQQRAFYDDVNQRITTLEGGAKPTTAVAPVPLPASNVNDQEAYQQAYNLIVSKQYDQANAALQNFATQYPKSTYVPNAFYWQGEIYALQNKPTQAQAAFQQLLQQFPNDAKAPDAKFRLAVMAADNHDVPGAKKQLAAIIKDYPNSSTATLAATKLRQLKG